MAKHLAVTLLEAREDPERRACVSLLDRVVELETQRLELGDVARQQVAAVAVEGLEVAFEDLRRHRVVERGLAIMLAVDHLGHEPHDAPMALARDQLAGGG